MAAIRSVGVATMKGAPGVPTSVVTPIGDRSYVAFGGVHPVIARYALGTCGAASSVVPLGDVSGAAEPLIVQGAYTYLGIVGRRRAGGSALVLSYDRTPVVLAGDNPLVAPGDTLIAASNPARIVPDIVVASRNDHGGRTALTLVHVDRWGDVLGGPHAPPIPLASLLRAPSAMTSFYSSQQKRTSIILVFPGPRPGALDVYAFDTDTAL